MLERVIFDILVFVFGLLVGLKPDTFVKKFGELIEWFDRSAIIITSIAIMSPLIFGISFDVQGIDLIISFSCGLLLGIGIRGLPVKYL